MLDRAKIQSALTLCLAAIVEPSQRVADLYYYLEQVSCHLSPRDLKILLQQHPDCVGKSLDTAMRHRSFGQFGVAVVGSSAALRQYSPLLTVAVVGRQGSIPDNVQPMAIGFLENGVLKVAHAPTADREELWVEAKT